MKLGLLDDKTTENEKSTNATVVTNSNDNAREEKHDIVTSLFTGNPDIPYIPKSDVTRISEKVFSEDSFSSLDVAPHIVSIIFSC